MRQPGVLRHLSPRYPDTRQLPYRHGRRHLCIAAALLFGLGPYATYTHGWVATIADCIWVACTLAIGLAASSRWAVAARSAVVFFLTGLALLAKEAAVIIPALLLLAWCFSQRERRWFDAAAVAAIPVAFYLAIRLHTILTGAPAGSLYDWELAMIPRHWFEYQIYPLMTDRIGAGDFLSMGLGNHKILRATILWLLFAGALWVRVSVFC